MKAIILAGGKATRLRPHTENTQKCLLEVSGHTVLDYQLSALEKCNVTDIAIVTGYCAEKIHAHMSKKKQPVTFIDNREYEETNNAYGLLLARSFVEHDPEGFLVINSDLIFEPNMLKLLIDSDSRDGMLIERTYDLASDMVKVEMEGKQIREMRKDLPAERVSAQALGPVKFSQAGGKAYLDFIAEERKNWLFYTISDYAKEHTFHGIENSGYLWAEIDTPEDLEEARKKIPFDFMQYRTYE